MVVAPNEERGAHVDPAALEALRTRLQTYMVKKGLRSTAQRRLIIDTFFEGAPHMTIEDLLQKVRNHDRGIGYATVYRTLKLLAECGVASERRFGDGLSRYELADEASAHHDHLICLRCGKIIEFEEPRIEQLQDEIAEKYGFLITSHKHEMYGHCADCQRARKESGEDLDELDE
ncbi:Fur family transcriptional regulator [Chondromyces crocatus]|uniref:Ferric uptake regulation protein n=1 Tax=Chondromyces crocatus TaxID=52 RepID=A0A0K1E4T4_CHOCO|nr:transcriptional repressor [Chondromyces crocatus]AKT35896.1 Fur family transcriptional regulator [Chondromyces crocatus]